MLCYRRAEDWITLRKFHHAFLSIMQSCIACEAQRVAANIAKLPGAFAEAVGSSVASNHSFSDAVRRLARTRIGLRPGCAASGFFQCLVGYSENEEAPGDLVVGVISGAGMIVHGNGPC
jgi:hypothetical protein